MRPGFRPLAGLAFELTNRLSGRKGVGEPHRALCEHVAHPRYPRGILAPVSELIFLVEDAPEGGYTARALGASVFTEADDLPSLHARVRDAVRCHFEEGQVPKVVRLHFVREEVLAV